MNRLQRSLLGSSALLLVAFVPWFASCADSTNDDDAHDGGNTSLGEASTDGGDANADANSVSDAGCDASDPACVSQALTCDEAAWCPVKTNVSTQYPLTSIWGTGPNDVWAVGSGGMITHYDGTAWVVTPTTVRNTFHGVWGSGPNDVYAVSMTDVVFHTTGFANGAATWSAMPAIDENGESRIASAVWGSGPDEVHVGVGARGTWDPMTGEVTYVNQYRKAVVDGGVGWEPVTAEGNIQAFWGASKDDVWYVADNSEQNGWQRGMTVHGTTNPKDGTILWKSFDSQATVVLEAVWGSATTGDVWAAGDRGVIRHYTKGASRWEMVSSPTTETIHGMWGSAANDVWAVGDAGTILHWNGTTWTLATAAFPLGTKPNLFGIWGSGPNDVWIVGDGIALHYTGPKPGAQEGNQ